MKMEINMGMNMGIQRWMLSISSSVFFEEISSQDLSLAVVEGATYVQLTTVRTTLVEWWAGSETKDGAVMTSWPRAWCLSCIGTIYYHARIQDVSYLYPKVFLLRSPLLVPQIFGALVIHTK
jgi:hypothetical protein